LNSAIIGLHLASNAEDDRPAAASLRPRFRAAQVGRHFAIVDVLLVARLAAEPLLGGAERPAPDVVARVRWRRCQRHREYLLQIRILHRCRCYCTLVVARRARSSRYAFTNCDKADGSNTEVLSPRLVSLIADLMQDWRRLAQARVEWVQDRSMALAESLMTGPPAARNAALRERRNEAMKALSCLPRERVGVAREIGGRRRHVGKSCPNRELFRSPNHLIGLVRTCGRRDTDAAA
jgi:hypothetical protein